MKQLLSLFIGIACLSLIGLYPKCVQGDSVELGPTIGIGFSFGPININFLELSIPLSWFLVSQVLNKQTAHLRGFSFSIINVINYFCISR
ncbi:hypothetical protein A2239_01425 [Candidatus Uhrbacteria bacterium RIFOXYA2_FULL_40_9]|nr:MAG: hypothetical protein A2239_01425 [Candidatus Uhrbacteria bacterium RIFOXYA2_FULL_40_9]OGL98314.1 MAG: hypothetical protein A2332_03740 [Candidatus Uhrbacteria bacterium RIFOXYB2_FULL_41_18]HBK34988.1 hypothetical protein [Candidatus Uhrbacteria bacterium]HCB56030.1 hypothetical protein [Candidatus Uhrbacteria bacterium]